MPGPLNGIRVIDLTSVAMGPYATALLGDMGADVIKVESPEGDLFRYAAPSRNRGMGAPFLNLNRNKRSIVLDLRREADLRAMTELLAAADVFVASLRPLSLKRLGLDYETLSRRNPRLIYCGAYGFSETGPYAGRPAYDDIIQAMSGQVALEAHGGAEPTFVNTIMADKTSALTAVYAISAALYERERSGLGQAVEVPMFETMVAFNMQEHLGGETFRPANGKIGYERVLSEHRRPHKTRDGYVGLLPYTDLHWKRFFEIAGRPELAADPRFIGPAARSENATELYRNLAEIIAERTTAEWVEKLSAADIPITPVMSLEDVLNDPHLRGAGFFQDDVHPTEGEIRTMKSPVNFSRTPSSIRRLAPRLGEHREEILAELRHQSAD